MDINISHVSQKKFNSSHHRIDIYFTVDHTEQFYLIIYKENEGYKPYNVIHLTSEKEHCPLCKNSNKLGEFFQTQCSVLNAKKEALFQQLIEMPNIRLEWVFLQNEQ